MKSLCNNIVYDKTQTQEIYTYKFPHSKFIEYEESDLVWAVPVGYAILDKLVSKTLKNDVVVGCSILYTDEKAPTTHDELIEKIEVKSTSLVHNPFSNWKPKWNPELVG